MAGKPGHPRWDLSNWTPGKVTLFEALGIKKGTVEYPKLQPKLLTAAALAADENSSGSSGSAGQAGSAVSQGVSAATGGNTVAPASGSQADWAKALLTGLGAPLTKANINSVIAWMNKESPWNGNPPDGAEYTHNPLNTTLPASGATSINSDGVKKYTTAKEGLAATIATIRGYPQILAALRSGKGLCGQNLGASFSKWSNGGYSTVC